MIIAVSDAIIWIGSIAGGLGVLWSLAQLASRRLMGEHDRRLLGQWHGYGYFEGPEGPVFYYEAISVTRNLLLPWRLSVLALPHGDDDVPCYRGRLWTKPPYLYCSTREPVHGDTTFEIGRRVMNPATHADDLIVGLHLGVSYEETIHVATTYVWSRSRLGNGQRLKASTLADEEAAFREIAARYVAVDSDSQQLKLGQHRAPATPPPVA